MENYEYDVFVSHASEDKAAFVEPLARELRRLGLKVWYDKFTLKAGDSLRESIEAGLSRSRYGAVVFSKHFLSKKWPKAELNGLFTLETEGRKVIIPVWHNISASEMKAALPIQADKVALLSRDGVDVVAKSIVEIVRPELLEIEKQKERAFESSSALIDIAKSHHPGYSFSVHTESRRGPSTPGTLASVTNNQHRIDISVTDPALVKEKPTLTVTFTREGAEKLTELYRTGKQQTWKPGEFTKICGTVPMFPSGDAERFQALTAASNLGHLPSKHIRIEVGTQNPIVFPLMDMRPIRGGADEAEAIIRHSSTPLEMRFVFSFDGSRKVDFSMTWDFPGKSCSACKKTIDAIDQIRGGCPLRIYDLETGKPLLDTPAASVLNELTDDPLPPDLRRLVQIGSKVEEQFGTDLKFTNQITDQDAESLAYLDCLLNGHEYGTNFSTRFALTKPEGFPPEHASFLNGSPFSLFLEPTNYPGFFTLFGKEIRTPPWGFYTGQCVVEDFESARARYERTPIGEEISLTLVGQTPTYIRWKSDCAAPAEATMEVQS